MTHLLESCKMDLTTAGTETVGIQTVADEERRLTVVLLTVMLLKLRQARADLHRAPAPICRFAF
jgi:hypothetical protein